MLVNREKQKVIDSILGPGLKEGQERIYWCPKCTHHKPKLSVNVSKNAFKCWICKYAGRLINLVKRHGTTFDKEEWKTINNLVDFSDENETENHDVHLPNEFVSFTSKYAKKKAFNYLVKDRGLSVEDVFRWKMGYCDTGDYGGYIVIPSFDKHANLNFFVGRSFCGKRPYKAPRVPVNEIIFNEINVDWSEDIVLVEGVFDSINAYNSIALLGSTLKEGSYLFNRLVDSGQKVFTALDPDAKNKERDLINLLIEYDVEVYKVDIEGYKDVGEMSKKEFANRKNNATFMEGRIWKL